MTSLSPLAGRTVNMLRLTTYTVLYIYKKIERRLIKFDFFYYVCACLWQTFFLQSGLLLVLDYSKTCVKMPLSKKQKMVFKTYYRLMQVKSNTECSKGFRPSLSYHLSLKALFSLFLSVRFTQVLLYINLSILSSYYNFD